MVVTNDPSTAPTAPAAGAVVSPGRRVFTASLVGCILFLIFAGAEVKSREAGLSVPDWPKSYGMWMPPMVGNVFYEHGHRMIAATVGFLTVILAFWTAFTERRSWMRTLGWVALGAVIVQGVLGGLTVIYLLPTPISMAHGALAQTFLCVVAWMALANGREWSAATERAAARAAPPADGPGRGAYLAAVTATAAVYIQLLLGAWMRHSEAGLAVPWFPTSEDGRWMPAAVDTQVVAHMLHRGFAAVAGLLVLRAAWAALRSGLAVRGHALLLAGLVVTQITLGAFVIWERKAPVVTSTHVVCGAGLLLTSWLLVLRTWRLGEAVAPQPAPRATAARGALEGA